jgi:hypothetical protein
MYTLATDGETTVQVIVYALPAVTELRFVVISQVGGVTRLAPPPPPVVVSGVVPPPQSPQPLSPHADTIGVAKVNVRPKPATTKTLKSAMVCEILIEYVIENKLNKNG